ncbi:MAG: hypothetical protein ACFNQI_02520 [Eikenella corrodens]
MEDDMACSEYSTETGGGREGYLKICAACFQVALIGFRRPVRMALTWQFTFAATLPRTIPFCCGYVFR